LFAQRVDAVVEGPDARQHQGARVADFFRALDQPDFRPHLQQRFVDAAQVARAIIK